MSVAAWEVHGRRRLRRSRFGERERNKKEADQPRDHFGLAGWRQSMRGPDHGQATSRSRASGQLEIAHGALLESANVVPAITSPRDVAQITGRISASP